MGKIRDLRDALGGVYDRWRGSADYNDLASYWERRAPGLIEAYDHPETWEQRNWMRAGVEEETVPRLLRKESVESVLVPGAGTGRQYSFLLPEAFEVRGFDISETLVRTCLERFPEVDTIVASVVDAASHEASVDAVVTSAVLQHVPADQIDTTVSGLKTLARRAIVIRQLTRLDIDSSYQFAHDYAALFSDWTEIHREVTDESDVARVELIAWRRD